MVVEVELYTVGEMAIIFGGPVNLAITCTTRREFVASLIYHNLTSILINETAELVSTCRVGVIAKAGTLGSLGVMACSSICRQF